MQQESGRRLPSDSADDDRATDAARPIRMLHVEDSADDAYFVTRRVHEAGIEAEITRVERAAQYRRLLEGQPWDLILVDCRLPYFSAHEAIEIRGELGLDIPILIVTGSIGEEAAVEYLVAGAEDIVIKGNWTRLAPAIRRTLATSAQRREKERADRELKLSHDLIQRQIEQLRALRLIDQSIQGTFDLRTTLDVVLDQVVRMLGVSAAAVLLLDEATGNLEYKASHRLPESAPLDASGIECFSPRQSVRMDDLHATPEFCHTHPILRSTPFRAYHAHPLEAKGRTLGILELFNLDPIQADPEWESFLAALTGQAAIAISDGRMFERLQRTNLELAAAYDQTIEGWAHALDLRDKETEGHSRRVTEMTVELAARSGISGQELTFIRWGALLHDIGKMGVPDNILLKPGPLTEEEWRIMKLHPVFARDLLKPIAFLRGALDIPYCHHEKWDGTGYPEGIAGEAIPLSARLFAVVDIFDALSSDRPYRPAWPKEKILAHLRELRGSHLDPAAVDLFLA